MVETSSSEAMHHVHTARCSTRRGSSTSCTSTTASQVLIGAAPSFLAAGPTNLCIGQAGVAIIWQFHVRISTMNSHPGPIAIDLHVFPHHSEARIHAWRVVALAAFALLGATPLFLGRRPSSEEIAQGCIAVKSRRSGHMDGATGFLNTAGTANIALHLHLTVSKSTSIIASREHVVFGPMDAIHAGGAFARVRAHCMTFIW
mmetsp:Transcript_83754/g.102629  ORF Transcript_83754/g.102629 Transcript_83754/m.102629 type:complete len:202 (-) Transcript_83754:975-1580(-)